MDDSISGPRRVELGVMLAASAGVVALGFAPAARLQLGTGVRSIRFLDLSVFGWVFVALLALLSVGGVVAAVLESRASTGIAVGYALLAILALVWIAVAEGLDALVPRSLLPATVRRFTVGLGAGYGAWLSVVLLGIACLAAWGKLVDLVEHVIRRRGNESDGAYGGRLATLLLLATSVVFVGVGRDVPFVTVEAVGDRYPVRVWALPFGGPFSLVLLWVMAACVVGVAFDRKPEVFACIGAAAAWLAATASGLALATTGLVVKSSIIGWVADLTDQESIASAAISRGSGAHFGLWFSMLAGLLFAVSIALARES